MLQEASLAAQDPELNTNHSAELAVCRVQCAEQKDRVVQADNWMRAAASKWSEATDALCAMLSEAFQGTLAFVQEEFDGVLLAAGPVAEAVDAAGQVCPN